MEDMSDLGPMLHNWRDRISPQTVGLPVHGPRRAPGLRREELASLAGLSVDYLTRLEQGRATAPSAQVLGALARALRLTDDERDHLFLLGGQPAPAPGQVRRHLTPGVQRLLDRLDGVPVAVYDAGWYLVAWNRWWAALLGDPTELAPHERNLLRSSFTGSGSRVQHTPHQYEAFQTALVADLRSATARYPRDGALISLVSSLRATSSRFVELWASGVVAEHREDRKRIAHPEVGLLTLDCDVLTVSGSDLRVVTYTAAPGSADADALALLAVLGTQTLS
jgi:transcriptional regulator with XRE-family HTH domain